MATITHEDIVRHYGAWLVENPGAMQPWECYAFEMANERITPSDMWPRQRWVPGVWRTILNIYKLRRFRGLE